MGYGKCNMRIIPIITALIVTGLLYLFVVERDLLRGLIGFSSTQEENTQLEESNDVQDQTDSTDPETKRVRVLATTFEQKMVETRVTLTGTTEAARYVDVKSETSGLVISEPFRKGENVKKGDVLCELDPGTRLAALEEAKAQLNSAEINALTASRLADGGLGSEANKTSTQAALQATLAAVERAKREISRLSIIAPFDGLLETDAAEIGSFLQTGSLCATIIQLNPIKIVGYVSENDVDKLEIGIPAQAKLISGRDIEGIVTFLSRSADPSTRTFKVEITVDNSDLSIRDGLTAEISILAEETRAHLIPQSSLTLDDKGQIGVRTIVDDVAKFEPVNLVLDSPRGAWVQGLPSKVDVIVVGQEFVIDGTPVEATYMENTL